ncbi:MAG TPA: glycosyltransferase family 39 protein [Opitutaceae bacterium]|nr:glycosyltransferase family 39 protein [Opitutaceae bacterium]
MPAPTSRSARWLTALAVTALLALHFTLGVGSKRVQSTTSDEIAHLTGGFAYWQFNDYRLQPENGNLPQRWAALPAYLEHAKFPTLDQIYWRTSEVWVMGHEFFYETGQDHFPLLMEARAMIALFSVGTGLLVFLWSRALFGTAAGFFSLSLLVFSPLFLAHGALATSDVCMVFFFVASLGAYWRHLHDGRWRWAVTSMATFGLACVAKFSAVLLLPMFLILAVARVYAAAPVTFGRQTFATRPAKTRALLGSGLGHGAVGVFIIWAFYGFRYAAFNPAVPAAKQFIRRWDLIDQNIGLQGKVVDALAALHALPEAFLYGFAYVIDSAKSRASYLNGDYSLTGWPTFFPWTFLLKTTLPVLLVTVLVVILAATRWRKRPERVKGDLYRVLPLAVLFVVYWAFSLTTHLNIGQRHIMPTYPVLFIAAGLVVAMAWKGRRWLAVAAVALAGWQAIDAARIAPYYLAYFNRIAGGPANGYRHLVDSSLDWGQDLPGLKSWLDANVHEGTPVYLSYFGTGEPDYYHIHARRLEMINGFKIPQPFVRLEPGVYCISTTALVQVYSGIRGPWTLEREKAFESLRQLEPAFADYDAHPERRAEWHQRVPKLNWADSRELYELLRFARLCAYLRAREPDAQIGYSINIYHVSQAELDAAVNGSFAMWRDAITRAIKSRPGG